MYQPNMRNDDQIISTTIYGTMRWQMVLTWTNDAAAHMPGVLTEPVPRV